MKKVWFISVEVKRIASTVSSEVKESVDRLRKQERDPMFAIWTKCAKCGTPYENFRATCSKCGRKYD